MRSLISLGLTLGYSVELSLTKSPHFRSQQTWIVEIAGPRRRERLWKEGMCVDVWELPSCCVSVREGLLVSSREAVGNVFSFSVRGDVNEVQRQPLPIETE